MSTTEKRLVTLKESDALRAMPAMNVPAMISAAIDKGANIDTLTGLFQLARDVSQMTARQAFFEAKAEFKRRCPRIKKTATADIPTRTGGKYSYSYSPLDEVTDVVDPILSDLGLSYSWKGGAHVAGHVSQVCILAHKSGHEEDSGPMILPLGADGRMSGAQQVGSVTTYARRYSLCGILGITPEADDDARGTNGDRVGGAIPPRADLSQGGRSGAADGSPAHVPSDPDDPSLVTESRNLFPTQEDEERGALIKKIQAAGGKLQKRERGHLKKVFLGDEDADVLTADVSALAALLHHLEDAAASK